MYGLATATTEPSMPTMITPRATLTRVNQGLSRSRADRRRRRLDHGPGSSR